MEHGTVWPTKGHKAQAFSIIAEEVGSGKCEANTESERGCNQAATHSMLFHDPTAQATFSVAVCDRHRQLLRDARCIVEYVLDHENDQLFKWEMERERAAAVEKWAQVFIENTASTSFDPDALAKKAYEFAHAMIDRDERYASVLRGAEFDSVREHPESVPARGHLRTYFHDGDLLKKAAKNGGW
jgi:hypothetical protein